MDAREVADVFERVAIQNHHVSQESGREMPSYFGISGRKLGGNCVGGNCAMDAWT